MNKPRVQFETADLILPVPSLVSTAHGLALQWFGVSSPPTPPNDQFFFQLNSSTEDEQWGGKWETFRVIYVGQLKDLPNPQVQSIADQLGSGGLDTWVLCVVSGAVPRMYDGDQLGPASFLVPMRVMLADPYYGPIVPRSYSNFDLIDEEHDRLDSTVGLVKCPGCDTYLPESDQLAQSEHMIGHHPDIVEQRRVESRRWDGWEND